MLERYDETKERVYLPFSKQSWTIDINGLVLNEYGNEIPIHLDYKGEQVIWGDFWRGYDKYKLSLLIALCFKNPTLPLSVLNQIDILHIDGVLSNFHPSNLVWKFSKNGLMHPDYISYAIIPGFTKYGIDRNGVLIKFDTGRIISAHQTAGYYKYRIVPDIGDAFNASRHRLLALAYLDYCADVDILDVNHLNGIRGDDRLENLEWATRQRNCQHAYSTGLRTDNHEIMVRNVVTNEVKEYYSYEDCARDLGLNGETVRLRVKAPNQPMYPGYLQFKRKNDSRPWRIIDDPEKESYRSGIARKIKTRNILTNEVKIYDSAIKCGKALGITKSTVLWQLNKRLEDRRPHRGHDFKWEDDETEWPIYSEKAVEMFLNNPITLAKSILIKDKDTEEEFFQPNISSAIKFLGLNKVTIYQAIREKRLLKHRYYANFI